MIKRSGGVQQHHQPRLFDFAPVAVALEIVDSRIADWKLTLPDTAADNAGSGAVVLGDWVSYGDGIDLATARASLSAARAEA